MSFSKLFLPFFAIHLVSCGGPSEPVTKPAAQAPVAVPVIALATVEWPATYEAAGTVRARLAATLSSRAMGYVQEVRVQAGDTVQSGQTLVTLDARELESGHRQAQSALAEARSAGPEVDSAIAGARAQLELAQTTGRRMSDLLAKRSVSQQEFDESAARVKVAQAGLDMALAKKQQLGDKIRQAEQAVQQSAIVSSYAEVKAPWPGRIVARRAEPGVLASPGMPLLDIEQLGAYRLEAPVEESRLGMVKRGQAVTVKLEASDAPLQGRVSEIVPAVDSASRAVTVKIDLPPSAQLRGGMFGTAEFTAGAPRNVLAIPRAAVLTQGQVQSVMVADSGIARSRMVTLGATRGDTVEVLTGLDAGDKIIHPRPAALTDGARVEVRQ